MFKNVLILCHANICRSPAAEGLLKKRLMQDTHITIQSAGIHAMPGLPAASDVIELLQLQDINLTKHRSRQVNQELLAWSDLILVMETVQQKDLGYLYPGVQGKAHCLGKWQQCDIPDPFSKSRSFFEESIQLIDHCLAEWQRRVWSKAC